MRRHKSTVWYTIYEAHGDRLIVIGTAEECAAYMGFSPECFRSTLSRVKSGENKAYCIVVENLKTGSYTVYGSGNTGELRGRPPTMDYQLADELYAKGLSDSEIGRQLGVDKRTVYGWRKKN